MAQKSPNCGNCQLAEKIFCSPNCLYTTYRSETQKNNIFIHNGNLISYSRSFNAQCEVCLNSINDCVYIKGGKYCTLSKHSNVTVIDCEIKKRLFKTEVFIMGTDIGLFMMPMVPSFRQKLLLLRDITVNYEPRKWVHTMYSLPNADGKSSEDILKQSIFTAFIDDKENVYLIDKNGKALEYEKLTYTGEKSCERNIYMRDWQIYANDKIRVKIYGYYGGIEILTNVTNVTTVGKHTKPALH